MRTVFVNPRKRRSRRKSRRKGRRRNPILSLNNENRRLRKELSSMQNPRRRRRRVSRRRRRNAGITPFVQGNPYILANPHRRRHGLSRRRSNPGMPNLTMKNMTNSLLSYGSGSGLGAATNLFALQRIDNMWARNGARIASAVLGGMFLRGDMGASLAGAIMYPAWVEIAAMLKLPVGTDADLDVLSADLEDILGDDGSDDSDTMDVW